MKLSELMLDMATGDASMHDVYIQEAVGKINVSSAIFDAAYKISELPKGEFMIVQEAADAGLPTTPEGGAALANQSVKESLKAFYDLVVQTAKKVKQATEKDMKAIIAIGKKYGISATDKDFTGQFVDELVKAIMSDKGKKLSLGDKKFLKGKYSIEVAEYYGLGMANFLSAFGMTLDDTDVEKAFKLKNGDVNTFKDMWRNMSKGGKLINFDKTVSKEKHYVENVSANDIQQMVSGLYMLMVVAKAVVNVAGSASAKKSAMAAVETLCSKEDCENKKVSKTCELINEGIKDWTENLVAITDVIAKAYTDSVYSLTEALAGGPTE